MLYNESMRTTNDRKAVYTVCLSPRQVAALDQSIAALRISRSEAVRRAIALWMAFYCPGGPAIDAPAELQTSARPGGPFE